MRYCFKARTLALVGFFSSITKGLEVNIGKITFRVWQQGVVLRFAVGNYNQRILEAIKSTPKNKTNTPPPFAEGGRHGNSRSAFLPTQELPTKVPQPVIEKNGQFSTCRVWNWLRTKQGPYLSHINEETWGILLMKPYLARYCLMKSKN